MKSQKIRIMDFKLKSLDGNEYYGYYALNTLGMILTQLFWVPPYTRWQDPLK